MYIKNPGVTRVNIFRKYITIIKVNSLSYIAKEVNLSFRRFTTESRRKFLMQKFFMAPTLRILCFRCSTDWST